MRVKTHFIPTSHLKLYDVVNDKGEDMGQVQNFILDMCSGRIAYALVAFGGFLGLGDKWIAMPFDVLTWQPEKEKFELDVPRQRLEKAPGIKKSDWPEKFLENLEGSDHAAWLEGVYAYYDSTPFWIEDTEAIGPGCETEPECGRD
jgi:sporulation protein YlmC with PRC-barrel domain